MCGIVGIVGRPGVDAERGSAVRAMAATLVHRGPDGEGFAACDGCDLGFRRLAINDLAAPARPWSNEDGSIWSVCNGEIYNYPELADWLYGRGHRLATSVDTEVLPHLYEEEGWRLVDRLDGMFAFAVWDEKRRRLVLGRDRAGEKPLYYWDAGDELVFASELRAVLAYHRAPRSVDPVALRRYLLHDFFPAPLSPIAGIRKLEAAHVLIASPESRVVRRYWNLADFFAPDPSVRPRLSALAEELDHRIGLAVRRRSRSDVPVGVFLSGGIDSSTVLSHAIEQLGRGVPAFTLGFSDAAFDESTAAARSAAALGADLHTLVLGEKELEEGLERVAQRMDEPLGDSSTISTHALARFARRHVKVVLSGEGADELLAGYPTYLGHLLARGYRRLPSGLRRRLARDLPRLLPAGQGNVGIPYLLARFMADAEKDTVERHHCWFGSLPPEVHARVLDPRVWEALEGDDPFASARRHLLDPGTSDELSGMLYMDFSMYLQDDLLTKVDRATMLASLEARAPFLDHRLAEFVAGLPSSSKLHGLTTKAVLRRAARTRLPAEVLRRRKRGFSIPFSQWLLHGLGERLRERFSKERVSSRGLFSHAAIAGLLDEHLSRTADRRKPLFTLLAFDQWCDRVYGEGAPVPLGPGASHEGAGVP